MQSTHNTTSFEQKSFPIVLILDGITSPANLGSLFRLADAFNIESIISCGSQIDLKSNRLKRTARATVNSVKFEESPDSLAVCKNLRMLGYHIMALEITSESKAIDTCNYAEFEKIALVLGNEQAGISPEVLNTADELLHINMFGKNSSMNVSHAAGIALFEITKSLQPVQ